MDNSVNCRSSTAVVLPSLDPDAKFTGVVKGLVDSGFQHIVIVNDGSDAEHRQRFEEAAAFPQCTVLEHPVNRGKGRALKTAFEYILRTMPELKGAVTIDGDGQHLLNDIIACTELMLKEESRVVLGCRDFTQPGIPPRSVAGNRTTSRLFRLFYGITLSDTQTGLRAIPMRYLPLFCQIKGERFEYETNMLLQMKREGIEYLEQPIATVYDPEDYSSHYNAVKDSWRIFKVMFAFLLSGSGFRYIVSAVSSWIIDNGLYLLLMTLLAGLSRPTLISPLSQVGARTVSSLFNFNMNKLYVFKSGESYWKAFGKYYCVCVPQTFISTVLLTAFIGFMRVSAPAAATLIKIVIELLLFIISYQIQKRWVFRKKQ